MMCMFMISFEELQLTPTISENCNFKNETIINSFVFLYIRNIFVYTVYDVILDKMSHGGKLCPAGILSDIAM